MKEGKWEREMNDMGLVGMAPSLPSTVAAAATVAYISVSTDAMPYFSKLTGRSTKRKKEANKSGGGNNTLYALMLTL